MGTILSIHKTDFDCKLLQGETKTFSKFLFGDVLPNADRLLEVFDNSGIEERNFCIPIDYFQSDKSFAEKNNLFKTIALDCLQKSIIKNLSIAGVSFNDITDIILVNTTGLSTPSLDALLINSLKLNPNVNRYPLWGLGCAGGVSGLAKANTITKSNPDAIVLFAAVELCSLTFRRNDISKSNFIATSLFSDGAVSVLILGDNAAKKYDVNYKIEITDSMSRLYYDSEDVMGWEFLDDGFKVVFSKDIPAIITNNVRHDIDSFLKRNNLSISDIKNFIAHPGGAKVIQAYIDALNIKPDLLNNSREILRKYGNMSSVSVLYVLEKFLSDGFDDGYGLMISLGPGFSSEMALLKMSRTK